MTWNDPANLLPTPKPLGVFSTAWASTTNGGTIGMAVPGGTSSVAVDLSSTTGSATLDDQVDTTNGVVTITPPDLTSSTGLANVSAALVGGTPVKAFAVPQADGSIKAYVLFYLTGNPASAQCRASGPLSSKAAAVRTAVQLGACIANSLTNAYPSLSAASGFLQDFHEAPRRHCASRTSTTPAIVFGHLCLISTGQ